MSQLPGIATSPTSSQASGGSSLISDVDLDVFLKLMITELQNQDPLNPLENDQLLAQISQIREVGATDRLTETLESVLLGQNIASATNLIGADVVALSDDNKRIDGIVQRVSIDEGESKLHVERAAQALPSDEPGNIEAGQYRYRVVWQDEDGQFLGFDVNDGQPVFMTGDPEEPTAIEISGLPATPGPKNIYRTDKSGQGAYHLVATLSGDSDSAFTDTLADQERFFQSQTGQFIRVPPSRSFTVSLRNVAEIRPPARREATTTTGI